MSENNVSISMPTPAIAVPADVEAELSLGGAPTRAVYALTRDQLMVQAKRMGRGDPRLHWTAAAAVVGRIHDEGLWKRYVDSATGEVREYRTPGKFAEDVMDVAPTTFYDLLRLWQMVTAAIGKVSDEAWLALSRSRASLLRRVLADGGDPAEWVARGIAAETTEDLRAAVEKALGNEVWLTVSFRAPESVAVLFEETLHAALNRKWGREVDVERTKMRDIRFQCVEVVCAEFLASGT